MLEYILIGLVAATVLPWVVIAIKYGARETVLIQKIMALKDLDGYPYNSKAKASGGAR